jgi:hypothetical protein
MAALLAIVSDWEYIHEQLRHFDGQRLVASLVNQITNLAFSG